MILFIISNNRLKITYKAIISVAVAIIGFGLIQNIAANPRITFLSPYFAGQANKIGKPLGLAITFSESVYGFDANDIVSNGRVLAVDGSNRNYRIVVVPSNKILVVDVLADGAKNIRAKGNDPIDGGPFIYNIETNTVLSRNYGQIAYAPSGAYLTNQFQPNQQYQQIPQYQQVQQYQQIPQAQAVQQIPQAQTASQTPTEPKTYKAGLAVKFMMNIGSYGGSAPFINRKSQSLATSQPTNEITTGVEIVKSFANSPIGVGFYSSIGYQITEYATGSNVAEGLTAKGRYTALPLELGASAYFGNYVNLGFGVITHFNGVYSHEGSFDPIVGVAQDNLKADAKIDDGAIGATFNLGFVFNKIGFSLRYMSLPLKNFNQDSRSLGYETAVNYETLNSINSAGFFLNFRS